jgi:uncharacterized protein
MPAWPEVPAAGIAIGVLFGLFGVGGSSFATRCSVCWAARGWSRWPPLPATIPAAVAGMLAYVRRRQVEWPVARWSIYGGVPGTVLGALLSKVVGGQTLLILSGVVLAVVGVRILLPLPEKRIAGLARRRPGVVIPAAGAVGLFTGLLANGGGFLLVPLFVLVLGLTMPESAGTSLVVIAALSVPTLVTHWALGHIDWSVAAAFAGGAIPCALGGAALAPHLPAEAMKRGFGVLLIGFAVYFVAHQIVTG